jgi:pimeloyl-ACP methyl ester carboxylesterase
MVISAVAQNAPDRIHHLVYLDAILPRTGEAVVDLIGLEAKSAMAKSVLQHGDGWFLPVNRPASEYGIDDPALAAWVDARLTPQPYSTYTDVLMLSNIAWNIGATYIRCERSTSIRPEIYERARHRARYESQFSFRDLNAGHDAMITHPDLVAEHLDSVASEYLG